MAVPEVKVAAPATQTSAKFTLASALPKMLSSIRAEAEGLMAEGKSTLQSILSNVRDAAVQFAKPYQTPANIPGELTKLLAQLGIADPAGPVRANLENAVRNWGNIGNQLSGLDLDFIHPDRAIQDITDKANLVKASIDAILNTPAAIWAGLGASGAAIAAVFPKRLLDFIVYEFLTRSHPKIGGTFLLFAVLRREFVGAAGPAFVDAEIRVFDLAQFIRVITNPREAVLTALRWGTDDFNARPVVDGMAILVELLPNTTAGADDQTFAKLTENVFVQRGAELDPLRPSALHSVAVQAGAAVNLQFVGLHRRGVGVLVENPVSLSGGVGLFQTPNVPPGAILALAPGPDRLVDPPKVEVLIPGI